MAVAGIITAIVMGLLIGALGRLVVPGKQNIPIWLTIVVGVVAALLGTFLARAPGSRHGAVALRKEGLARRRGGPAQIASASSVKITSSRRPGSASSPSS